MKNSLLYSLFLLYAFTGCKQIFHSSKTLYALHFGESGGFTGAKREYILKGDGRLYYIKEFGGDTVFVKTVEREKTRKIFKIADSRDVMSYNVNKPGNMNYFIRFYKQGQLVKDILWSGQMVLPGKIQNLHLELDKLKQ
jgi:hypothetical protein